MYDIWKSLLLLLTTRSRTNLMTDVKIVCSENKVISSHRLVLAVTSQYFQDVLYHPREGGDLVQTIKMTDVDHSIMMTYLSYIYTGSIDMPSMEDNWELLRQ